MKVYVPQLNRNQIGGGWSFINNLRKALPGVDFTEDLNADMSFVPGATMVDKPELLPRPIVLRLDGIPHDERNRGSGMNKLKKLAEMADYLVYQSEFAKRRLKMYLGDKENSTIITNGVDTELFRPKKKVERTFVYVSYRKDPAKRFEEARELFTLYAYDYPDAKLALVGRFATDQMKYGYGFYNNEKVQYVGVLQHKELAELLGQTEMLLFPSYMDWCPNTVLEAMSCGCGIIYNSYGGVEELVYGDGLCTNTIYAAESRGIDLMEYYRSKLRPEDIADGILVNNGLTTMGKDYLNIFIKAIKLAK